MSEEVKVRRGSLDDLTPDDRNMNKHTSYGMSLIEKSIRKHKFGRSILVDKNDRIIGGNGVTETAASIGATKTIVVETTGDELVVVKRTDVDLDSKEGREMALADNATAVADIEWDAEAVKDIEGEFEIAPEDWGVVLDELDEEVNASEDDFNEETDNVESVCKIGEVWQLGRHRLMCGDSTSAEDVDKLMNGETADMWLTDPPYNVNLSDKVEAMNEYMKNIGEYKLGGIETAIKNDAMSDEDFVKFLICTFNIASDHLKPGGAFYVWTAQGHNQLQFAYALDSVGLLFRQQIIWKKKEAVLGRQDYQWRHEPCFYGWKEGAGHYFVNLRNQNTVIEDEEEIDLNKMKKEELKDLCKRLLERPHEESVITEGNLQRNHLHPTMKPVRLFGRLVRNSSKPDQIILDTFGGSGTTIIACEQLNRKARLMELDPKYCSIIIARWEKLTGKKAEMVA